MKTYKVYLLNKGDNKVLEERVVADFMAITNGNLIFGCVGGGYDGKSSKYLTASYAYGHWVKAEEAGDHE